MSFFKRLFGLFSAPSEQKQSPSAQAACGEARAKSSKPNLTFTWQELIDGKCAIAGYQLQPMALGSLEAADGQSLADALARENISRITTRRRVIVPITCAQWRQADFKFALSANTY